VGEKSRRGEERLRLSREQLHELGGRNGPQKKSAQREIKKNKSQEGGKFGTERKDKSHQKVQCHGERNRVNWGVVKVPRGGQEVRKPMDRENKTGEPKSNVLTTKRVMEKNDCKEKKKFQYPQGRRVDEKACSKKSKNMGTRSDEKGHNLIREGPFGKVGDKQGGGPTWYRGKGG